MFSNLPPLGFVQVQTLGGVYSGLSVIPEAPVGFRAHLTRSVLGGSTKSERVAAPPRGWDLVEDHADIGHGKLRSSWRGIGPHPAPGGARGGRPRHPPEPVHDLRRL